MYIKKDENFLSGNQELPQIFKNEFNLSVSNNEIVKMYQAKVITPIDLKITKFLFSSIFATVSQIKSFLLKNDEIIPEEEVEARLDKLVQYRVLNKFILSDGLDHDKDEVPKDALNVYCLDLGGIYLIQSFTTETGALSWMSGVNLKCSGLVLKTLFCNEFRLKVLDTLGPTLNYFRSYPKFSNQKTVITPTFDMGIKDGNISKFLICQVFTENDPYNVYQEQICKMEILLSTNAYKKYYPLPSPPPYIVITDNEYTALEVAKRVEETKIAQITRYTTEERLQKQLSELGAFLKYQPESETFKQIITQLFKN